MTATTTEIETSWARVVLDHEGQDYYVLTQPYSATDPLSGPTLEEARRQQRSWVKALREARAHGFEPADPEIHPEEEQPDGTFRWHLEPIEVASPS